MADEACYAGCLIGVFIALIGLYSSYLQQKKKEEERQAKILSRRNEWGQHICDMLIAKQIAIDMTMEMVRYSWGEPTSKDQQEILKSGVKIRWVYGIPRRGAKYINFKNGHVTKIKM